MSLINQMLQDLDKRDALEADRPVFVDVRHSGYARRKSRNGLLIGGGIAVVAIAAGAWFWFSSRQPAPAVPSPAPTPAPQLAAANPPPVAEAPAPAPVTPPAVPPAPTLVPLPPAAPAPVPVAEPTPPPPPPPAPVAQPAPPPPPPVAAPKPQPAPPPTPKPAVVAKPEPVAPKPAPVVVAKPALPPVAAAPVSPVAPVESFKVVSPQQRSENLYRQAVLKLRQGQGPAAQEQLRQALDAHPANRPARQMLAGLLLDAGRHAEAETLLQAGMHLGPPNPDLPMALARAQVAGGKKTEALATLEQGLATAGDDADYHAFYAALLQNVGRHDAAVNHFITALRSDPSRPNWLIGAGISLRAIGKPNDAAEAFRRALDTGLLTPQVAQFAEQQLQQMR